MFWYIFEKFIQTFFPELAERMFNFVYENYLMWIKVTKYNEN